MNEKKHYKSVFENEGDLIVAILDLHNGGMIPDCEPMFFKGNFWKEWGDYPKHIFDINPQEKWIPKADAQNLPLESNSIKSIILDPPFMFGGHGKQNIFYSSRTHGIMSWEYLQKLYKGILKESYRILSNGGVCFFKCQDYTDSKTTMTHCLVYQWALENGFYAKDLAILVKPNKVTNPNLKQRHLRKIHTYFWVFIK